MMSYSPWNKLLSGCESPREEVGEAGVWAVLKSPGHSSGTLSVGTEGRDGSACSSLPLEGGWKHLGLSSSTQPFQMCSLHDSLGRIPRAKGSPAPGNQGKEAAGGAGGWGNMGGGEGWQKDEGQGCPGETSTIWRRVSHLLCSIPIPKLMVKGSAWPPDRTSLPSALQAEPRHPDPSGCTFPRLFTFPRSNVTLLQPG